MQIDADNTRTCAPEIGDFERAMYWDLVDRTKAIAAGYELYAGLPFVRQSAELVRVAIAREIRVRKVSQ